MLVIWSSVVSGLGAAGSSTSPTVDGVTTGASTATGSSPVTTPNSSAITLGWAGKTAW